jgi:hypothetical protein
MLYSVGNMHKDGVRVAVLLLLVIAAGAAGYALAGGHWVIGGVAALWCVGGFTLLLPARPPQADRVPESMAVASTVATPAPIAVSATNDSTVDLGAAAAVCTSLSRITRTSDLPPLLAQAAGVLDAAGIILWMGAGDQLFAVASHGYASDVLNRLGPIPRGADNATASAWRTGQLATVAGVGAINGALVAPLFRGDGCIGALAIELRHGGEDNRATHAVALMIAAQLAAVVPAWPSASTPEIRSATA